MDYDPQYRLADGSALRVWKDAAQNNYLSEKHGRPIYDEAVFVEVISPGSAGSSPVFEVKRTFAPEMEQANPLFGSKYAEFKDFIDTFEKAETADNSLTGTPLREWPAIGRTLEATLRASSVFSVEALANLPDEKLGVVGPDGREWREKAKAWLEAASDASVVTRYAAENLQLREQLEETKATVSALAETVSLLQAPKDEEVAEKPEVLDAPKGLDAII